MATSQGKEYGTQSIQEKTKSQEKKLSFPSEVHARPIR